MSREVLKFVFLFFFAVYVVEEKCFGLSCDYVHKLKMRYRLVRHNQRSQSRLIHLENTQTLADCEEVAKSTRGLALNYAPSIRTFLHKIYGPVFAEGARENASNFNISRWNKTRERNKQHFWDQAEEFFNCHVLECPENETFASIVNDSNFDYFSLFGDPKDMSRFTCLPEVGLFEVHLKPENYINATRTCTNFTNYKSFLANVNSERRTNGLQMLLREFGTHVPLAYVGLVYNRTNLKQREFQNSENESLKCFLYRAWAPGHPKISGHMENSSCGALSVHGTWLTMDCETKLPFICELSTETFELLT